MNPEYNRERTELYWEKRRLSESIEKDLQKALNSGREVIPDMINCPNSSCRYPLQVKFVDDCVELRCTNCEFKQVIKKDE